MTIRERILEALQARLAAGATARVFRSRLETIPQEQLPAFELRAFGEKIFADTLDGAQIRDLNIRVACIVADSSECDKAADVLLTFVEQQVAADETFGGLALEAVVTDIGWAFADMDFDFCGGALNVAVRYRTERGQPDRSA